MFGGAAEVGALHERDAGRLGPRQQLARVDAVELEPEEVAALGRLARAPGRCAVERGEHRVAAGAQQPDHALEVRLERAAADELVHGRLAEQNRRDVGGGRRRRDLRAELLREDEPADPQAGRDRLRERRAVDRRRRPRARRATAAPRPRSGRARTGRPRAPAGRARRPARRSGGGARRAACGRSGSGRSGSGRGTPASPAASSRSSASRSRPSSSVGIATTSAPSSRRIFSGRS